MPKAKPQKAPRRVNPVAKALKLNRPQRIPDKRVKKRAKADAQLDVEM